MLERQKRRRELRRRAEDGMGLDAGLPPLPDDRSAKRLIRMVLFTIVASIGWAGFAPVHETVSGQGQILPADGARAAQHLDGGLISAVLVSEGEEVTKGQVLAVLDLSETKAELSQLRARQDVLSAQLARWQAVAERREYTSSSTLAGQNELAVFRAETALNDAAIEVLRQEERVAQDRIELLTFRLGWIDEELELLRTVEARRERMRESGTITVNALEEARGSRLRAEQEHAEVHGLLANARLERARAELELQRHAANRQAIARSKIAELTGTLVELREKIVRIEAKLKRDRIVSPVDGRIQSLAIVGPGEVVQPGAVVASVVPNHQELFAELLVPADRIGEITTGVPASVRILAYDFARYGAIDAEVIKISPTSEPDPNGRQVYRVRLRLSDPEQTSIQIRSGLTLTADMRTGSKTVLEYFLKPIRVIRDRALTEA